MVLLNLAGFKLIPINFGLHEIQVLGADINQDVSVLAVGANEVQAVIIDIGIDGREGQ